MSDDEYERCLAYVAGMRDAAKLLREYYSSVTDGRSDAGVLRWHQRNVAQRIEREAARLEKEVAAEYEGT